jgi:hypothetical protein
MDDKDWTRTQKGNLRLGDGRAVTREEEKGESGDKAEDKENVGAKIGNTLTKKDKLAIIVMPIVIVGLTAILGTGVGVWLQNRSFRNNEIFKAKLERIMAGQREAADILREVDEARRQIRSNEDFIKDEIGRQPNIIEQEKARRYYLENNPMEPSVAILRESKVRLDTLAAYTSSLSTNSPVPKAVQVYSQKLEDFLKCLKENVKFEKICSDEHPNLLESMRGVVVAHTRMTDELIKEYE